MDRRAAALLTTHGYDASRHRAQQFTADWFADLDLVLAMDRDNVRDVLAYGDHLDDPDRLRLFREFDPRAREGDVEVPDPYYGGDDGFAAVLAMVERTCDGLVAALERDLRGR
jgi:protein-tyrosine phosphatase